MSNRLTACWVFNFSEHILHDLITQLVQMIWALQYEERKSVFVCAAFEHKNICCCCCCHSVENVIHFAHQNLIVWLLYRYGILIDPFMWLGVFLTNPYSWPSFCLVLCKLCLYKCLCLLLCCAVVCSAIHKGFQLKMS